MCNSLKTIFLTLLVAITLFAHPQQHVKTCFEITNESTKSSSSDNLYYKYSFPKGYTKAFFPNNDSILYIYRKYDHDNSVTKDSLSKDDIKKMYRSPLYGILIPLLPLTDIENIQPHEIVLVSQQGENYTHDKITKADIKKIKKTYAVSQETKSTKQKIKTYAKSGNSQGELMGANRNIRVVKRTKCSTKKKKFRKEGINGVKEMTFGF